MKLISLADHKKEAIQLIVDIFGNLEGLDMDDELKDINWGISRGFITDKGELIGLLCLAEINEPFNRIDGKGIQGVALAIKEEYRNQKLSKQFLDYGRNLPFDYAWGEMDKRLNNLSQWLKVSDYLGENEQSYFTYKKLK